MYLCIHIHTVAQVTNYQTSFIIGNRYLNFQMRITVIKMVSFHNLVHNMVNSIVLYSTHSLDCYREYALSVFYLFILLQVIVVRRNVSLTSSGTPVCQLYEKLCQKLLPSILAQGPHLGHYYLSIGRPRSRSVPAAINVGKDVKKRKQWTNEVMMAAMKFVMDKNTPIYELPGCMAYQN